MLRGEEWGSNTARHPACGTSPPLHSPYLNVRVLQKEQQTVQRHQRLDTRPKQVAHNDEIGKVLAVREERGEGALDVDVGNGVVVEMEDVEGVADVGHKPHDTHRHSLGGKSFATTTLTTSLPSNVPLGKIRVEDHLEARPKKLTGL
mmetsp:Transcript_32262/g.75740  ORF Transcript_32262/g.75740 Transcript_32262/m.75740 type:complete len:147 (-) Transcript_32262:1112-1552(-)